MFLYPHSITYEKLIKFYILRNERLDKIVNVYHELWDISNSIKSEKLLKKYVDYFMKEDSRLIRYFYPEIIEKYLESYSEDKIAVKFKLSQYYDNSQNNQLAIKHYQQLLEDVEVDYKIVTKVLENLLNLFIVNKQYDEALSLIENEEFSFSITQSLLLKSKTMELYFHIRAKTEVENLLNDVETENYLQTNNIDLYWGGENVVIKFKNIDPVFIPTNIII